MNQNRISGFQKKKVGFRGDKELENGELRKKETGHGDEIMKRKSENIGRKIKTNPFQNTNVCEVLRGK